MITFIVDGRQIKIVNCTLDYLVDESSGNVIDINDDLTYCYLEYCDNSDDYDTDEEGYSEWLKFIIANDGVFHSFVDNTHGDIDVVEFLKSFSSVNVIVKNNRGAEIC